MAFIVHDHVDPLAGERGEAADLRRVKRLLAGPGDVGDRPVADGGR